LKKLREDQGDVLNADFKGPWASYKGMEKFTHQVAELTTEQQAVIKKYEQNRKERLQEAS
jgi:hypothetical protein